MACCWNSPVWSTRCATLGWQWLAAGVAALGLASVGVWASPQFWKSAPGPTPPALSVAILPFAAPPGSPTNEQFADAVTEDLSMTLERNLRVALVSSRSVTAAYKGKTVDARTVGRELNVRYLVEGKVRGAGDGVAVSAQLIDTDNATQVWS